MEVELDKFGRIVMPKAFRDQLGIKAGDKLTLSLSQNVITLEPALPIPQVRRNEDGILILAGGRS